MPVRSKNSGGGGGGSSGPGDDGVGNYTAVNDTDYTLLPDDFIVGFTALSAPRQLQLPNPATLTPGQYFLVKDQSGSATSFNINVNAGAALIDGQSFIDIIVNYGGFWFYTDGVNYFVG